MKDLFLVLICYVAGIGFGFYLFGDSNRHTEILGTTYSELSSMKRECELVIPRNQECVASIVFLPTAIEE